MCTVNLLSPSSRQRVPVVAPSFLVDVQTRLFSPGGLIDALDVISRGLADAPVSVLLKGGNGTLGCIARHPSSAPDHPSAETLDVPILFENRQIGMLICARTAAPDSEQASQLAELGKLLGFFLGSRHADTGERRAELSVASRVEAAAHRAARHSVTAMLVGESGSGKRSLARWIHAHSPRSDGPFICLDGKYETENLSEKLAAAVAGTLYLADIDRLSAAQQAKLLRALEARGSESDGASAGFRLIASATSALEELQREDRLIPALAYRLHTMQIVLPALRERRNELPELIAHLLHRTNQTLGTCAELSAEALIRLANCDWPGNLRQLNCCIEEIAVAADANEVLSRHAYGFAQKNLLLPSIGEKPSSRFSPIKVQRQDLVRALEQCGWVQAKAARLLNLSPRQIAYAIDKHGIALKRL